MGTNAIGARVGAARGRRRGAAGRVGRSRVANGGRRDWRIFLRDGAQQRGYDPPRASSGHRRRRRRRCDAVAVQSRRRRRGWILLFGRGWNSGRLVDWISTRRLRIPRRDRGLGEGGERARGRGRRRRVPRARRRAGAARHVRDDGAAHTEGRVPTHSSVSPLTDLFRRPGVRDGRRCRDVGFLRKQSTRAAGVWVKRVVYIRGLVGVS